MSWESNKGCGQCRRRRNWLPDHLSREPSLLRTKVHRVRGVMIRKGLDPPGPLALLRSSVGTPLGGTGLWRLGSVVGQGTPSDPTPYLPVAVPYDPLSCMVVTLRPARSSSYEAANHV